MAIVSIGGSRRVGPYKSLVHNGMWSSGLRGLELDDMPMWNSNMPIEEQWNMKQSHCPM